MKEFAQSREELFLRFSRGDVSWDFLEYYTEIVDEYFRKSLEEESQGPLHKRHSFALVALGGYGRRELCYHSDIDVMVLFKDRVPQAASALSERLLYPLWDLGLEIGYAFRTIKDCLSLAREDFTVLTSLIDGRFVCGDFPLFLSLMEEFRNKVIKRQASAFSRWLAAETHKRMAEFGDASYLLEPNLKYGTGGLRDYHAMLWLAKFFFDAKDPRDLEYSGILSHIEYRELLGCLRFIWLVRNHLHRLSRRKNDRLHFEYQPRIAGVMDFRGTRRLLPVEAFLGRLHASMAALKSFHRSFLDSHLTEQTRRSRGKERPREISPGIHLHHGEVAFDSATAIPADPILLLEIFEAAARLGTPLSLDAKRLVKEFIHLVDEPFRTSAETGSLFLGLLEQEGAFETLDQMLETGFLEALIPEFREIRDHIQFDNYHVYPVGRHALQTFRKIKEVAAEGELLLPDILSDLNDPVPLYLAALLHDIGKGRRDHSVAGAGIAARILDRLGYDKNKQKDILFLIRNHLLLAKTATRRDLNDEKAIVSCARIIGTIPRLKMLYLLTWADSKATGPRAWNEWIANLVQELFFRLLHVLEKGELATPVADMKTKETLGEVRRLLAERMEPHDLDRTLDSLSLRYCLDISPSTIAHHINLLLDAGWPFEKKDPGRFSLEAREERSEGAWEVTVLAMDRPGLFSDIAGVLALNGINILSAHIYTWEDGTAVDIFRVTPPLDPLRQTQAWERVRRDLRETFEGRLHLSERLKEKGRSSFLRSPRTSLKKPQVIIDNEASDFFTLIEVFADDRIGLLHDITRRLFELGITIRIAKVATKVDQVADIFYVRDQEGRKLTEKERVEEIRSALLEVISSGQSLDILLDGSQKS